MIINTSSIFLLTLLVAYIVIIIFISYKKVIIEHIDWDNLQLPHSPNYCLVTPNSSIIATNQFITITSPKFNCSAKKLEQILIKIVQHKPRIQLAQNSHHNRQKHYIQRSLLFRFPDLITFECQQIDSTTSTLYIYSRSIYGHSDFGVNKRRVQNYLHALESHKLYL